MWCRKKFLHIVKYFLVKIEIFSASVRFSQVVKASEPTPHDNQKNHPVKKILEIFFILIEMETLM